MSKTTIFDHHPVQMNWVPPRVAGSGGDRWGGTGTMLGILQIGNPTTPRPIAFPGSYLGQYINLALNAAQANAHDLLGGLFACLTNTVTQTMGKLAGISSYLRNPSSKMSGANQSATGIRSLIYTGTQGETQHQAGILVSILDMTTTKTVSMDTIGIRVQLNVANAAQGGNLSGIVLDNVGTVDAYVGLWFLNDKFTHAFSFANGTKPANIAGTVGSQAGYIKVIVGGSTKYIPLYGSVT